MKNSKLSNDETNQSLKLSLTKLKKKGITDNQKYPVQKKILFV